MQIKPFCCVLIPYKDRIEMVAACLRALLDSLNQDTVILLIDDDSTADQTLLIPMLQDRRIVLLRHDAGRGPAAARNTGIAWCRSRGIDLVILLDSDCIPAANFVSEHVSLHAKYPDAVCIGGAIQGEGSGIWAKLDGIASWFTSVPGSSCREIGRLYHIPTTNMSLKLLKLPIDGSLFEERLRTGEDVQFIRRLRMQKRTIIFSPLPLVRHRDRTDIRDFLLHHFRWGLHTYAVRFGMRKGSLPMRIFLAAALTISMPFYALAASIITLYPWIRRGPGYLLYLPAVFTLWIYKTIGVILGTCMPGLALHARQGVKTTICV